MLRTFQMTLVFHMGNTWIIQFNECLFTFVLTKKIVRALRDKNRSRANCVPIYGDLHQNGVLPLI